MAAVKANPRLQVGSASWISGEKASALQIADEEAEEFAFSARNEVDWLNEHMTEIFSKNQVNVAEIFKTPGKLRGKTPRTVRKLNPLEVRAPLSNVFSAIPRGAPTPLRQAILERPPPTFKVAEDQPGPSKQTASSPHPDNAVQHKSINNFDSGYFGSQFTATQATQPTEPVESHPTPKALSATFQDALVVDAMDLDKPGENLTPEGSNGSAIEEAHKNIEDKTEKQNVEKEVGSEEPQPTPEPKPVSQTARLSPSKVSPQQSPVVSKSPLTVLESTAQKQSEPAVEEQSDEAESPQTPSDGSSPIRPIVRKSSLNFASLPAREPLTTKKSIGNRVSRTSQLDRTSHYGRQTGGKSLGNAKQDNVENEDDEMDLDKPLEPVLVREDSDSKITRIHNKTSTQRLQDQISKLGQSQTTVRPTKSITNILPPQPPSQATNTKTTEDTRKEKSPQRKDRLTAPGAFPDDEDDNWIGPPTTVTEKPPTFSPRPQLSKSHSTDIMEGVYGNDSVGGSQISLPKRGDEVRQRSPLRDQSVPESVPGPLGHTKSISTSVIESPNKPAGHMTISVSNPNPSKDDLATPLKSPSRSYKGSPLKAAKDKFSSILKTSRGLFASSAAVSAEAKSSALSAGRMGMDLSPGEGTQFQTKTHENLYPSIDTQIKDQQPPYYYAPHSPTKPSARKTRASTEKEERRKEAEAKAAREAKEAQKMTSKLEKARMKVDEEARVYRLEQERVASMQKEVDERKEQEDIAKASEVDLPRATRSSPRKTKAQLEAEGIAAAAAPTVSESKDVEMCDAPAAMPPPAVPRPKSQIGRPGAKRLMKPAKESVTKAKPPTVIRVDTGSQRGHQYHPSNSTLSATLQESLSALAPPQGTPRHKASTSSVSSKASTNSFKSAASKALEAAARKKEQDELTAQRKREAKLENERQRAAIKEEERRQQELQRQREAERQREIQRERQQAAALADAKKAASRQAVEKRRLELEKAKQQGAPPPAARSQHDHGTAQEKALPPVPPPRDLSKAPRLPSTMRSQEDLARPVNTVLHNTTKAPPKRPLPQDADDHHSRPNLQRNGPSYQHNDAHTKRRKTSENFDDEDLTENHPKMTAPPIRQSGIRQKVEAQSAKHPNHTDYKKDAPTKSLFPNGYTNAPQPTNLQRNTLISQHNMNQSKASHPMDMAQVSKAPIPFAASSSQPTGHSHKTPARPGTMTNGGKSAKSTAKPSPQYQNGESIDLPEIHTDSEDEDEDAGNDFVALGWTNSPDLRKQLALQETIDPQQVFGQPGPLNMEEVFSKSKDRFKKFRDRTSSANWSGLDRLTDDEIKKDLEARDRVRRQGGWTYDSMI